MSLINDMLRDLDQRQAPTRETPVMMPKVARPEPRSPMLRRVLLIGLALVLLAMVSAGLWWSLRTQNETEQVLSTLSTAPVSEPAAVEPTPAVAAAPVQPTQSTPVVEPAPELATPTLVEQGPSTEVVQEPAVVAVVAEPEPVVTVEQPQSEALVVEPQRAAPIESTASAEIEPAPAAVVEEPSVEPEMLATPEPASQVVPVVAEPRSVRALEKTRVLTPAQKDQTAVSEATRLWQSGHALEAEKHLRQQVAEQPNSDRSRALLAQWLIGAGRSAEAEGLLLNVNGSSSADLKKLKARLWQAQGHPQPALELLQASPPAILDDADYHVILAALYSQLGQFEEAVNTYASLVSLNPNQADWWAGLGIALEGDNQWEPAQRAYRQAVSLNGLHPQLQAYVQGRLQAPK